MSEQIGLVVRKSSEPNKKLNPQGQAYKQKTNPVLDLVFVIDTTGSMSDKIDSLLRKCQTFVDKLASRKIDWRIAIVAFGDLTIPGDKIVAASFSNKTETVKDTLAKIPRFNGGGNEGESSLEALQKAMSVYQFRPNAIKAFILLTDEPALKHQNSPERVTSSLRERGILTFVIAPPLQYYKDMAQTTGGKWFQISATTDFDSIIDMLIGSLTEVVEEVQEIAQGDVEKYLRLKGGH
ncbi:MAG TPA: vWA domain-containing protein [Candidatus Saccharimonadales bacterium]|nr:vWA domain-containing protein [Candidatus Saccharimonadales bacterium]